ncbi:allantoate deiminase [Metabacillus halosaccharovorans]|uniref:allantoate deiminase n=1 Tax=Metabacillus halosaccharovorans TaxID=930124 RepID=UPI0034CE8756
MVENVEKSSALFEQIEKMVEWLACFGRSERNGVTRLLYTKDWQQAQQGVEGYMKGIGLCTYYDDVGNLYGRLPGTNQNSNVILTGSHIDTVRDGGKYDGAYGIIAGIIALQYLFKQYGSPKKTIEVVSLCEEEGSRFPVTYWGSSNITGVKKLADINDIKDSEGISFVKAMNEAGFGHGHHCPPKRNDLECFIEMHIEQGIVLEKEAKTIGVVSHIVGQQRYTITVEGESNHAGTTPMGLRKDAMYAAAEMIQTLIEKGKNTSPELVVTVGQIIVEPNVSNVIPRKAIFSLDIRHSEEEVLKLFCHETFQELEFISLKHQTCISINNWMDETPVKMCETLNELSETILMKDNIPYKKMTSGAGHDSQIFGQSIPTLLLFVPSQNGISHSPLEFTRTEDLEEGIKTLIKVLYELAY